MIGAIFSMITILYYHTDLVKAYYYDTLFFKNVPSTLQEQFENISQPFLGDIENEKRIFKNMEVSGVDYAYPFTTELQTIPSKHDPLFRPIYFNEFKMREDFQTIDTKFQSKEADYAHYETTYEQTMNAHLPYSIRQNDDSDNQTDAEEEAHNNALFHQKHCKLNGEKMELMYKDSPVKPSMAEHVFPELQIHGSQDGHPCHPCDSNCKIHISRIDKRLNNENVLQQRNKVYIENKSSEWIPSWSDIFLPEPLFQNNGYNISPSSSSSSQSFAVPFNYLSL
jgi:hypothetical protein